MKNVQKGFTLIELMIVVAIIAILAAIAIPQYQNYITKAQFSESQTVSDGLKTPVVEYYNQTSSCPAPGTGLTAGSLASNIASYAGKYVASANVVPATNGCEIDVTFRAKPSVSAPLDGQVVKFIGTNNGGSFSWQCQAQGVGQQYKPTVCS